LRGIPGWMIGGGTLRGGWHRESGGSGCIRKVRRDIHGHRHTRPASRYRACGLRGIVRLLPFDRKSHGGGARGGAGKHRCRRRGRNARGPGDGHVRLTVRIRRGLHLARRVYRLWRHERVLCRDGLMRGAWGRVLAMCARTGLSRRSCVSASGICGTSASRISRRGAHAPMAIEGQQAAGACRMGQTRGASRADQSGSERSRDATRRRRGAGTRSGSEQDERDGKGQHSRRPSGRAA
jgi:hypothetical protein